MYDDIFENRDNDVQYQDALNFEEERQQDERERHQE